MNPRKRILIVEDEQVIRELMTRFLDSVRYDLVLAPTINKGLLAIERQEFDLLITDLRLPDGCGTEAIRAFRSRFPYTPAFVMTGSLNPEDILEEARAFGITECLYKPFDKQALEKMVIEQLEKPHAS